MMMLPKRGAKAWQEEEIALDVQPFWVYTLDAQILVGSQ